MLPEEKCPFCHTIVPAGATVCTGCHAERVVGIQQDAMKGWGIVAAVGAGVLANHEGTSLLNALGWGLGAMFGAMVLASVAFRNQITWRRLKLPN
ncbi:hypothetical protein AA12717_1380 [Gluconacetobacter sacchari DSM 12717]|uniref:Uncharacterized protein n=2 Tax=Gluconacetobacter sacchari TaxID=92759 RepID=A0A7W4NL06_9PROT|nr:hypothetical protein [Gluconacetobacter sacchari]MBB2159701.1 hypothetical protein [Gluconacetobacter sacchari]GBQ23068.1 hypothetical protein AA12717_1380 [Gluconacetobacter sacchari DSM 12717]